MYKYEEAEAKVVELSPIIRALTVELLRRGKQFDYQIPLEEALDSDLEAGLREALSDPALKREFMEFHQACVDAAEEDYAALMRGEYDHLL
jgi:hypothetical protein